MTRTEHNDEEKEHNDERREHTDKEYKALLWKMRTDEENIILKKGMVDSGAIFHNRATHIPFTLGFSSTQKANWLM